MFLSPHDAIVCWRGPKLVFLSAPHTGLPCRRLADALDGGVASLAAKHAVEGLHHLAVQMPTSRDLILATRALDKLVVLLQQSLEYAHYAMLKVPFLSQLSACGLVSVLPMLGKHLCLVGDGV